MPRKIYYSRPITINKVLHTKNDTQLSKQSENYIEVSTSNENKLREIRRILKKYEVIGVDLNIEEIQSSDPYKVISEKAKTAFEANGYNPILVEDTSLDIKGLDGKPGTYVNDFCSSVNGRRMIATEWLKGKDRSAIARVLLGIFDGVDVKYWEGTVVGEISEELLGSYGFGWDDMFIPVSEDNPQKKTFAQMSADEKDRLSMRRKALKAFQKDPFKFGYPVYQLPEPYEQELQRVQLDQITDGKARKFAYKLECLESNNRIKKDMTATKYSNIHRTDNSYFTRFLLNPNTPSLGLMLTDVDRKHLKLQKNGDPYLWQMGPERRHLALVQRADFFMRHQNPNVHQILDRLDQDRENFPKRNNRRSITLEHALGIEGYSTVTQTLSLKEIGYKKLSSPNYASRSRSSDSGLYTIIGKHARSIYAIGCLPWVSGWRDVIVTAALGHMPVFVHRNNINAIDFNNQIRLISESIRTIKELGLPELAEKRALGNIGAALGCDPKEDLRKAKRLFKETGTKLFRIYTINSDPRVKETALALRQYFGDQIEIFVGQIADMKQCYELIANDIQVDGLIAGHGGGRQCTSATNGMALTTLEELYNLLINRDFNNTTIMVEGGIGTSVGALLVMGVDGILRNAQLASCVIEQGDLYFEHRNGEFCQPYHGSASAPTMIIESYHKDNANSRLFPSGRTKNVEGKSGYIYYREKANSMTFDIDQFKHYAARTLADLGVGSIWELREFLDKNNDELLRIVSADAAYTASAWRG